jgi:hypothetical protein
MCSAVVGRAGDVGARRVLGVAVQGDAVPEEPKGAVAPGQERQRPHGGLRRPEPGSPPLARPASTAPQEIEFVPQGPTRWLVPKLLALIGVQVALSTKFAEFFDRRDAHGGALAHVTEATETSVRHHDGRPDRGRWSMLETEQGFDFSGAEELWLDYVSDSGDGFDATTTIALWVPRTVSRHLTSDFAAS